MGSPRPERTKSPHVTVRPAEVRDADAMRQLASAAFRQYVARIGHEPAPMNADYADVVSSGHGWVAERDGEVVGLLVLEPGADHLLLESIAVAPRAQHQGVGGRLLRLAEAEALAAGFREVRLYTNVAMTENLAFYPRRGYQETHRATEHGYRRVFFRKTIKPAEQRHRLP